MSPIQWLLSAEFKWVYMSFQLRAGKANDNKFKNTGEDANNFWRGESGHFIIYPIFLYFGLQW